MFGLNVQDRVIETRTTDMFLVHGKEAGWYFKHINDTYELADSTGSYCVRIVPFQGCIFNGSTELRERLEAHIS